MTGRERIRSAIQFQPTDRSPVAPLLGAHAVAQAGIEPARACEDPVVQTEALLRAADIYQPDGIFTLMDLSAEPEALGAGTKTEAGRHPVIVRHLKDRELASEPLEQRILTGRVPVFLETVIGLRKTLGDSVLVGALMSGPLTAVSNAVGIEALSRMLRRRREELSLLVERMSVACIALQHQYRDAGADAVALLEPVATTSILGPRDFETLLLPWIREITNAAQNDELISILHVCGDCTPSLALFARSSAHVLSLDSAVDLPKAQRKIGQEIALMGNLDVRHLLPKGSAQDVGTAARELVSQMGEGFILSTGCELPADTPQANVAALIGGARSELCL